MPPTPEQKVLTCQADDTYLGGHHTYIYEAFEETRVEQRATCTLESNVKKLKAFSVNHGVANVPQCILDAQGGHITGFKCVSAFVGPDTNEGTAWKIVMLTVTLEKKLDFLDPLDAMPKHLMDNKDAFGLRHYQYNYLSRCANTMPTYFQCELVTHGHRHGDCLPGSVGGVSYGNGARSSTQGRQCVQTDVQTTR